GQLGEIAATPRRTLDRIGDSPGFRLQRRRKAAAAEPVLEQPLHRLPRVARLLAPRAAAPPLALPVVAPVLLTHCSRACRASTPRARSRPSSGTVRRLSTAFTSGWMPWLCARLTPSGVKYSPIVSFSAPPFESPISCWKTP